MKIVCLAEDTRGIAGCYNEHGLCLYIETAKHKLLMDTGASDLYLKNADIKGIDLSSVDTVVISHGHYDHTGGISSLVRINPGARIYMQRSAKGQYYSVRGSDTAPRYIGIPCEIQSVSSIIRTDGDLAIDDELSIFARIGSAHPAPSTNRILMVRKETGFERDDFSHEQCLVVRQDGKHYLFSGCAHHGILNIMDRYRTLYEGDPDYVISGFHMARKGEYSKEDMSFIRETAERLKEYDSLFYTCHCTGEIPYNEMKLIMGDKLQYIHSGDELDI